MKKIDYRKLHSFEPDKNGLCVCGLPINIESIHGKFDELTQDNKRTKELYSAISRVQNDINTLSKVKEKLMEELTMEYSKKPLRELSLEEQQKLLKDTDSIV